MESVPIVDFSAYSLEKELPDHAHLQTLVDEIHSAFTTIGFVYLKNTGCPQNVVENAMRKSKEFFVLKEETKLTFRRGEIVPNSNFGYIAIEQEGLNPGRSNKDLKEAFNFVQFQAEKAASKLKVVPEVVDMMDALGAIHVEGTKIMERVLEIMAMGMKLEDPMFFVKRHQKSKRTGCLRSLHYPPLNITDIKEQQIRCGEHSDYGSITLLFQDDRGGLEVCNLGGEWVRALPIEGAILVNIGDLMQRWTSDRLIAARHRVMLPPTGGTDQTAGRQSMALFGYPDHHEIIECLDGSNKYPPIRSLEYRNLKYSLTYY